MTLRIGSRSPAVAQLQADLNAFADSAVFTMADELGADGIFGGKTEDAVAAFQRAVGLTPDGIAGPQTLGALDRLRSQRAVTQSRTAIPGDARQALLGRLVDIARQEVGTREVGGNNCGVRVREYQRATDLRPLGAWPWCAAFISWCIREWLKDPAVPAALGWPTGEIETLRPKTAAAFGYIDWGRRHEQILLSEDATPEQGMIVVFDFSHIGFVEGIAANGRLICLEGNTNGRGDRDSILGDGVWRKERDPGLVRQFISWRFTAPPPAAPVVPPVVATTSGSGALPHVAGIGGIPRDVLEFIIDEEGMDQPGKFPGGESGVTLGHGYDLGAETKEELFAEWKQWLSEQQLQRLARACGKSGAAAKALCADLADIRVTEEAADDVFYRYTVPKYHAQMLRAFPGGERLPGAVQGALLSLVFNRGTSMKGERREEMRNIRELIQKEPIDLKAVADEIRDMKRLWRGQGMDGLIVRREREARWVESAVGAGAVPRVFA